MKVTNYIAKFLKSKQIDTVFELQGGMITRIIDELYREGGVKIVSMHHEQAASFAADAYGRVTGKPGVALATSGPGATNLLTGIGNCYFDSVPTIFITGQVNLNEQKGELPIRQLGFQETDIVSVAKPLTKAAYAIRCANELPTVLEEAYALSLEGRPGPVLIDIPMNIQNQEIELPDTVIPQKSKGELHDASSFISEYQKQLERSKRPLLLVGRGVRIGGAIEELITFASTNNIPIVTSLNGVDTVPYQQPQRVGMIGSYGNRWANFALGTCDLLLVLGSRLDLRQTGSDIETFKAGKSIFHVDITAEELNCRIKGCTVLQQDVKTFLTELNRAVSGFDFTKWMEDINQVKREKPDTKELTKQVGINPNKLIHEISEKSKSAKAFTVDVGSNQMWVAQSIELTSKQQFLSSGGMGAMGFSLPAAIGACFASNQEPIVCFSGDGGFQINIQELQTIARNRLPIKIVILNNHCLGMIRQFQDSYFNSTYQSTVWGYSAPDFVKVANAYGINGFSISNEKEVAMALDKMWENPSEPFLLDVSIDIHTNVYPKMLFGNLLTKMDEEL